MFYNNPSVPIMISSGDATATVPSGMVELNMGCMVHGSRWVENAPPRVASSSVCAVSSLVGDPRLKCGSYGRSPVSILANCTYILSQRACFDDGGTSTGRSGVGTQESHSPWGRRQIFVSVEKNLVPNVSNDRPRLHHPLTTPPLSLANRLAVRIALGFFTL